MENLSAGASTLNVRDATTSSSFEPTTSSTAMLSPRQPRIQSHSQSPPLLLLLVPESCDDTKLVVHSKAIRICIVVSRSKTTTSESSRERTGASGGGRSFCIRNLIHPQCMIRIRLHTTTFFRRSFTLFIYKVLLAVGRDIMLSTRRRHTIVAFGSMWNTHQ
jgi:hypothetical protein